MTVNKSQDKTFDKVGIHLNRGCFSHGQLYVAFSRARPHKDDLVKMDETTDQGALTAESFHHNFVTISAHHFEIKNKKEGAILCQRTEI